MAQAGTILPAALALTTQLEAKGIPVVGVSGPPWTVDYGAAATAGQIAQGDAIAAAFDGKDRKYRALWQIYQDIVALSGAQKTKIWTDLSGGTPKKYLKDTGINAAAVMALDWAVADSGAMGTALTSAQQRIMTFVVQDFCFYLDQPVFDNTISILGIEPV